MKNTKIGKGNIQQIIKEEASIIKRKREIYEQIKSFNKELGELNKKGLGKLGLNERVMAVGAQGFGAPAQKAHPTGFVYPQNISHVAELEAELAPEDTVVVDNPNSKTVMADPAGKPMVGDDVKKQLIDMKEKLEMILSSLVGGAGVPGTDGETEAEQAADETETPEEEKEEETEEDEEDEETDEKE